ncbi:MAG: ankyrin repeat-rich rane spanning protein [Blastocatellia bacterium]
MSVRKIFCLVAVFLFVALLNWSSAKASTTPVSFQAQAESGLGSDASMTPLMLAIRDTDKKAFKSLLDHADVNASDDSGWTALMLAARVEEPSFVKALLERGAQVNVKSKNEMTPLLLAALYAKDAIAKEIAGMLIEHKADINVKGIDGATALMNAALYGKLKLLKLLLEKGAKLNDEDNHHATALTYALRGKNHVRGDNQETLDFLKSAGATGPAPGPDTNPATITIDQRPVPLNAPQPQYTETARKHGVEGIVIVRVLVGIDGLVKQVRVNRGLPDGLTAEAVRAAFALKFKPALKDGQPTLYWQSVMIEFHLRRGPGA